jgi:hypothetical protein
MAHFRRAVQHRIERAQCGHHFARREQLHGQPSARRPGDTIRKVLGTDTEAGEILAPGRDHAPGDIALRNRRHRQGARRNRTRGTKKLTSLHRGSPPVVIATRQSNARPWDKIFLLRGIKSFVPRFSWCDA